MERKKDPGFDMMEKLSSYNLPPDLDKQFAKQLCSGTTAKYRTHILDKSGHGDGIYVSGIAFFAALMGTAADLDDLYCSEKRTAYLKTAPVRHNDKRALTAGICKYLRDSFELYHLQELGSTRTDPELTQYRIGATLLANYHDLSRKWSRLWDESGKQDMSRLRDMIIEIESDMRHMPTGGRHHAAPLWHTLDTTIHQQQSLAVRRSAGISGIRDNAGLEQPVSSNMKLTSPWSCSASWLRHKLGSCSSGLWRICLHQRRHLSI
jgi:hypothetical protein